MEVIQIFLIFSVVTLGVLVLILLKLIRKIDSQFKEMKGLKLDDMHLENKIDEEAQKLQIEQQNIQNDILKRMTDLENEVADLGDFVEEKLSSLSKKSEEGSDAGNLSEYNQKRKEDKNDLKERILKFFDSADSVVNDDIEKEMGVSDATVTRYLDELEAEGKIEQIGESGRFVEYCKKR